jgi:hypothetical protein
MSNNYKQFPISEQAWNGWPETSAPPASPIDTRARDDTYEKYPPPISSDDEYPDSRSRGDYVETTEDGKGKGKSGKPKTAAERRNRQVTEQLQRLVAQGDLAVVNIADPTLAFLYGGISSSSSSQGTGPGILSLPRLNQIRKNWKRILRRVGRLLQLAHLGQSCLALTHPFIANSYTLTAGTQTPILYQLEAGTQTAPVQQADAETQTEEEDDPIVQQRQRNVLIRFTVEVLRKTLRNPKVWEIVWFCARRAGPRRAAAGTAVVAAASGYYVKGLPGVVADLIGYAYYQQQ